MKKIIHTQQIVPFKCDPGGGSDISLKQNITCLNQGLINILALRPVTWRWKDKKQGVDLQYGFIAQEVEQVLPELVYDGKVDETQKKFLTTSEMIPYLVAAIQEQQTQIVSLQEKLDKK